jgi:APA family basic amino acid/polyamine antiporter
MNEPTPTRPADLPRTIGFWGASAVMVGIIIGSGIFRTPASIAQHLGNPLVVLMFWAVGGVLSLLGALTYAELATMFPQSGGVYVFLREGFGRGVAFIFGWTYLLITKPLGAAGIAVIFAEHFGDNLFQLTGVNVNDQATTIAMLALLTFINVRGVHLGSGIAMVLTGVKVLALLAIVALGLAVIPGSQRHLVWVEAPEPLLTAIMPVMFAILWTYDGWSDVGAIAGEVRDPQRQLPRIYLVGTAAITLVYVAVNLVYMLLIPLPEMRGAATMAPLVVERLLGSTGSAAVAGGVIVTLVILISTMGSTHGSIITGARVTFAQAQDGLLFRFLGRVHPKYRTPDVALWSQLVLSCAAVLYAKTFDRLAGGFVFTMWIFYGLAAASIFVLRVRRPDQPRPYRCWGYPVVPAVFVLCAAAMTVLSIRESPAETLPWLGVLAAGAPVFWLWRRAAEHKAPTDRLPPAGGGDEQNPGPDRA